MKLQDGSRNLRSNRSVQNFVEDLCFSFAADDQQNFSRLHDVLDSHGVCLGRNILYFFKETFICLNGALGQVNAVCLFLECCARLVESDVAVVSKSKKLQVNAADAADGFVVCCTCFFAVRLQSVRNEGALFVDVDMIEQVCVHEVTIALIILRGESFVLVQVYAGDVCEIEVAFVVPLNQLFVSADRGRSGCKAEHCVRFHDHLRGDDVCCFSAHIIIIFCFN